MAILTGNEIRIQQEMGNIVIEDFDPARLGPNSYNLRLSPELMAYKEAVLDTRQANRTGKTVIPRKGWCYSLGICISPRLWSTPRPTGMCQCWWAGPPSGGWASLST